MLTPTSISIKREGAASSETMSFDYLVIATGSEYRMPIKDGLANTFNQRKDNLAPE